jgi:hypothetical protein
MVVNFTWSHSVPPREIVAPCDPLDEFKKLAEECLQRGCLEPMTPQRFFALENELKTLADDVCRQMLEREIKRLEPDDKKEMPPKVRYRKETYRINKKTKAQVATRFGTITVWSFYYLNENDGEPGLHPLRERLGIGAGSATPALLERVARMAVDHTQAEVRAWLVREHGLAWSNDRLRSALQGFRRALLPFVPELQKARLLAWLQQAEQSRGRHRPVLAAGRDGIMVPMRSGGYQEASTATVSVYDRQRRRLGTIYLGQMPEPKQTTLSRLLTELVKSVLKDYRGPLPRLAYITDKGSAPDDYYHRVLKKMKHPANPKQTLVWEWVLDFYHVCCYIGKMADALFGAETKAGTKWFARMRRWLRDRPQGAANVARSASQCLDARKMTKAQTTEFWKAYRYLRRHCRWMDYQGYRRRGLPIGSGVTEAACKTVFTQRFKRSGMRWVSESGQMILDLRTAYLSKIWEEALASDLKSRDAPEPIYPIVAGVKRGSSHSARKDSYRFAA